MKNIVRASATGSSQTGIFAQFASTDDVVSAVNTYGWPGVSITEGSAIETSPYTKTVKPGDTSETATAIIEGAYARASFWWMSVWQVSGPKPAENESESDLADGLKKAAYTAAFKVAGPTVMAAANQGGFVPSYIVLDPEGGYEPQSAGQAQAMIKGWVDGLIAYSSAFQYLGAWYLPGEDYFSSWDANSMGVPILLGTFIPPEVTPLPTGSNLVGYMVKDNSSSACANAADDVTTIDGWGANMNTLQVPDSRYQCSH